MAEGKMKERIALITGAARGIGFATADALAGEGATVVLSDILDEVGESAAKKIKERHGESKARFIHHDVTSEEQWIAVCADINKKEGGLDVLVNNAGIYITAPIETMTIGDFQKIMDVNVKSVFLGCKHAIPLIRQRASRWKGGGAVVNLSSSSGIIGSPSLAAYCASKGAVRLMTKAVATECGSRKHPVRVNSIHPGFVDTDMGEQSSALAVSMGVAKSAEEARRFTENLHILRRVASAEEIARAALFLASDDAAFMTGAEMVVDGGMSAR